MDKAIIIINDKMIFIIWTSEDLQHNKVDGKIRENNVDTWPRTHSLTNTERYFTQKRRFIKKNKKKDFVHFCVKHALSLYVH